MDLKIIVTLLTMGCVQTQFFEDRRCRCVCPSPASVLNTTITRQIYTGNVPPNQCHCEGVVFPLLKEELEGKLHIFCPRCECIYQTRNTTLIMAIVFLILMGIVISLLYMASFTWLKFVASQGRNNRNLFRQTDHLERPPERDHIREYRGEYQRERQRQQQRELELEQQLERQRNRHRILPILEESANSEQERLLDAVDPEN